MFLQPRLGGSLNIWHLHGCSKLRIYYFQIAFVKFDNFRRKFDNFIKIDISKVAYIWFVRMWGPYQIYLYKNLL